ncbi:MAG: hypothetical protein RLZZ591_2344 [Pseudomonadota bacterium]
MLLWSLAWLSGLAFALLMAVWQHRDNLAEQEVRFEAATGQLVDEIKTRMGRYAYGLRGARGLVIGAGGDSVTRERFHQYSVSRDIELEFPGARGFGFIRRVPVEQEATFVAAARRDGFPNFKIRQIEPHGGDRYVIQYIEPQAFNLPAVGLDVASEPQRRQAAELSRDIGGPVLTGPITLVQSEGRVLQSVLLMLPIYQPSLPVGTMDERRRAILGWAYAPLELDEVLKGLGQPDGPIALTLTDTASGRGEDALHSTLVKTGPHVTGLSRHLILPIYGRQWALELRAQPAFVRQLNQRNPLALFLMLGGGVSALMLLSVLRRQGTRQRRLIQVQQARMAAIVASSSDAVIGKTLEGVVTDWNAAAEQIFGYTAEEAMGRPLQELIIPDDLQDEEKKILAKVAAGESLTGFDTVRKRKDGTVLYATVSVSPIRDADGHVVGIAKLLSDITERKAAEAQIQQLNQTLANQLLERGEQLEMASAREQFLINNALSAVIVTDAAGVVRLFNPAAEKLLGYRASEVIGSAVMAQFHDAHEVRSRVKALSQRLGRPLAPGEIFRPDVRSVVGDNNEWQYVRRDGTRIAVLLTVGEVRNEKGELDGFIGISSDLTERKRLEQELQQANQLAARTLQAEAANEAKSLFLANMSHEIRTPLNALISLTYLLERTDLKERQRDFVRKMTLAGQGLLAVINDVLDLSRIEAGEMTLDPQPVCLQTLLQNMLDLMQAPASSKGLDLKLLVQPDLPRAVITDAVRLRQILTNLLGNAIKFTERGQVSLEVEMGSSEGDQVMLNFRVRDTGMGIPEALQPLLFKPFSQLDASSTRRSGGTGLGLYIVRRLVDLMGGQAGLESSQPDHGSVFWFSLTLLRADDDVCDVLEDPVHMDAPARLAGLRILLVDDSAINRQVGQQVLALDGADVVLAGNGAQALQCLRADLAFDLVLMDVQMPELDGFAATRLIRQEPGLQDIPIIALTAGALQSERANALLCGMNDYMAKPIDPDRVVQTILRHVRPQAHPQVRSLAPLASPLEPLPWPVVSGIQGAGVRERLGGDVPLFMRLLKGFAAEYSAPQGLDVAWVWPDSSTQVEAYAKRLHRLHGSAAMLGMVDLAQTAERVQRMLTAAGDAPTAMAQAQSLVAQLSLVLAGIAQVLQQVTGLAQGSAAPVSATEQVLPDLSGLLQALRARDLGALDDYERLSDVLRGALSLEDMARLDRAMTALDFEAAEQVLAALGPSP